MVAALVIVVGMLPTAAWAAAPTLRVADVEVTETDASGVVATVVVRLSAKADRTVTVGYATSDGTAEASKDYAARSGQVSFPAGTTKATVKVPVTGDDLDETNETFRLKLSGPTRATIADGLAIVKITDDDAPPGVSIGDAPTVLEGGAGTTKQMRFPVSLSKISGRKVSVNFSVAHEVEVKGGVLNIPAGTKKVNLTVGVFGDDLDEEDETVAVLLENPIAATLADDDAVGMIDDDDGPTVSIGDAATDERAGATNRNKLNFTVSLSSPSPQTISVPWSTGGGTAIADDDYDSSSGTVTFDPDEVEQQISVQLFGDLAVEPNETLIVTLGTPVDATLADSAATGTILDDDCADTTAEGSPTDPGSNVIASLGDISGDAADPESVHVGFICPNGSDWMSFNLVETDLGVGRAGPEDLTARISFETGDTPHQTDGELEISVIGTQITETVHPHFVMTFAVKKADTWTSFHLPDPSDDVQVFIRVGSVSGSTNGYTVSVLGDSNIDIPPNIP